MRLLIDHNISPYIARALAAIAEPDGHQVKAKLDKFDTSASIPDTEWLSILGHEGGWAFVSDDHRIYRDPQERAVMLADDRFFLGASLAQAKRHRVRPRSTAYPVAAEARPAVRDRGAARCLQAAIQAHKPAATDPPAAPLIAFRA